MRVAPSTLEELRLQIETADWFSKIGHFPGEAGVIRIIDLHPPPTGIEDEWDWLPTTNHHEDPIHKVPLTKIAEEAGKEDILRAKTLEFYKLALVSTRDANFENPLFRVGPHNMATAARGAALFAVRRAVAEIVTEHQGFWCALIPYYSEGYWPCGISDTNQLVIL